MGTEDDTFSIILLNALIILPLVVFIVQIVMLTRAKKVEQAVETDGNSPAPKTQDGIIHGKKCLKKQLEMGIRRGKSDTVADESSGSDNDDMDDQNIVVMLTTTQ